MSTVFTVQKRTHRRKYRPHPVLYKKLVGPFIALLQ